MVNRVTKGIKWIWIQIGTWTIYWIVEIIKLSFITIISDDLWVEAVINLFCGTLFFYALILFVAPIKTERLPIYFILLRLALVILVCIGLRKGSILLMAEWFGFSGAIITNHRYFLVSSFDIMVQFGTFAALVWFFLKRNELQKQVFQKQLDEERLHNELLIAKQAVIKAQINPHFLFNSLHFIHSKSLLSDNQGLSESILLLSDVLRYTLKDHAEGKSVSVNEELKHIKNLYEMNRLRFAGRHYMQIIEKGSTYNHKMPPFVLLTFFENAMKHGVSDNPDNPVVLQVTQSQEGTEICLRNKIRPVEEVDSEQQFAIGKRYVENILEQYYKNNYILDYQNDGEFYNVDLRIYGKDQLYHN